MLRGDVFHGGLLAALRSGAAGAAGGRVLAGRAGAEGGLAEIGCREGDVP